MSALWLPHFNASLNLAIFLLVGAGYLAIRRGNRVLHPQLMKTAIVFGLVFVGGYIAQVLLVGHGRFPGDDWVRSLFVTILLTHTALAVTLLPMLVRTVYLALKGRLDEHRRFAPYTLGIWLYVSSTGVVIYWMNNWLRPAL